ncbi:hypothetical protein BD560DRAFT_468373 [Blakeslea trispora]|nr:hypothetical protein BD560DRAFT_468373 [Blakeslea trispora]
MSPPNNHHHRNSMGFHDNNNSQNWFGTSMDFKWILIWTIAHFYKHAKRACCFTFYILSHLIHFTVVSNQKKMKANRKRRRRRESHNAVERRRRDNINERIHELCTLLPERLLDTAPTSSNVMSVSNGQVGAN